MRVLLGLALLLVVPAVAPAATVVAAGPTPDPGDGRRAGGYAVSFSPDGDGRRDRLTAVVRGAPGERLRAVAYVWGLRGSVEVVDRGDWATVAADGVARVEWDGMRSRRALSDGPYDVAVCDEAGACAAERIAAHLRSLAAFIRAPTSFEPGDRVPLSISADARVVEVGLGADDIADPLEAVAVREVRPGAVGYRLPDDIQPGLHRLVVRTGARGGWRALPLLVRPRRLALPAPRTTLVVMPYLTWSVYNRFDRDRDGRPDSHYQTPSSRTTALMAPYESPGERAPGDAGREQDSGHTRGLMRAWAKLGGNEALPAAFVTDVEFGRLPLAVLDRYAAVMFPGHTEYYTPAVFDRARAYQLRGGDFMYLSANGFFALVEQSDRDVRLLVRPQRTADRNDAMVTGIQYSGCCWAGGAPGPLLVTREGLARHPWVFEGTGLRAGDVVTWTGGEIDGIGPQSPAGMDVLASIDWRNEVEAYQPAQMVLWRRPGAGRVFSVGTMGFLKGAGRNLVVRTILGNVWFEFAGRPPATPEAPPAEPPAEEPPPQPEALGAP